ncbi:MAG: AAA family ATPase [Beijerinckiaceae bacterium]|nr:AAA family ATPase [Beijerinckiaceae bacterium]
MNSRRDDSQREVFEFLQNPRTHGLSNPVTRIDTHGAAVFLCGPDVYKVKRAVRFPFMDFSTLAKRRAACEAEIAVNRANAPRLYLGTVPITRDNGALRLGGDGPIVEWTVHLRRFDENATLDHLIGKGSLGAGVIDALAQAIVASHERAPLAHGAAATAALRQTLEETSNELLKAPDLFPAKETEALGATLRAVFDRVEPLLLRRGAAGQVRRCHGDLHLGNIVLIDDAPVLFDAIEFNDDIATIDILYDLAFVIMDLCEHDRRDDANRLLNRYISSPGDPVQRIEGLAAFPLFLSLRAAIRARVLWERTRLVPDHAIQRQEAVAYFIKAGAFLRPIRPCLIAIGGLSGTGKTTLAGAIAPELGLAPGAVHLRSDVERKRLFDAKETDQLPAEAYDPRVSQAVYRKLRILAEAALGAGRSVVVDATYRDAEERGAIEIVAKRANVPFHGFWLDAPVETMMRRVTERRGDASDATSEVVAEQVQAPALVIAWHRIDTSQGRDAVKSTAHAIIQHEAENSAL